MTEYRIAHGGKRYLFATDNDGSGLFVWGISPGGISPSWIQLAGTADFSVCGVKDPRAKIRRYMAREEWEFPARARNLVIG